MAQSLVQVHLTAQTQIYEAPIIQARSIFMYLAITIFISYCQINATACQPVRKITVKTILELFQYRTTVISLQFRFCASTPETAYVTFIFKNTSVNFLFQYLRLDYRKQLKLYNVYWNNNYQCLNILTLFEISVSPVRNTVIAIQGFKIKQTRQNCLNSEIKQIETSILPRINPFAFEHSSSYLQLSLPGNYDGIYMELWI